MDTPQHKIKVSHFSHHHPLQCANTSTTGGITCSACNLDILSGNYYYYCESCSFYLHQACYNMPRKTRHPGHHDHCLTLLVMPSSVTGTFKCKACGHHISGFYYNCAECNVYYHILCSVLQLSVAIASHPHALELEFSFPYDSKCDLCGKPCYGGWLYRCHLCEFDTHLACAMSNQTTQSLQQLCAPVPDPLRRQFNELMQLVVQGAGRGSREENSQEVDQTAPTGWDERLHGNKDKHSMRRCWIRGPKSCPPPDVPLEDTDRKSPLSGELSTTPSYQFSDAFFSVDLAKSYSSCHQTNQTRTESLCDGKNVVATVKETISYTNRMMLERIMSNLEPSKGEVYHVNKPGFDFQIIGLPSGITEAFFVEGPTHTWEELSQKDNKKRTNYSRGSSAIKDRQSAKSDTDDAGCYFWCKLLQCCHSPR